MISFWGDDERLTPLSVLSPSGDDSMLSWSTGEVFRVPWVLEAFLCLLLVEVVCLGIS